MRHVYIRGIMGLIWLAAAVVSGVSGNFEMGALYAILGGVFLYSAYTTWKKDKDNKGDRYRYSLGECDNCGYFTFRKYSMDYATLNCQ